MGRAVARGSPDMGRDGIECRRVDRRCGMGEDARVVLRDAGQERVGRLV